MIYLNAFLRVFKNFLKVVRVGKKWSEGVKNGVKWGKKSAPESAFIHYLFLQFHRHMVGLLLLTFFRRLVLMDRRET